MFPAQPLRQTANRVISAAATTVVSTAVRLILPAACRLCDEPIAEGEDFCHPCSAGLSLSEPAMKSACPRCGVPRVGPVVTPRGISDSSATQKHDAGPNVSSSQDQDARPVEPPADSAPPISGDRHTVSCPHCQNLNLSFDRVVSRWCYQGTVCDAVVAAKYGHQSPLGDALGRRLAQVVADAVRDDPPSVVTFVPSHFTRKFTRGGNGNRAIAEAVARCLSLVSGHAKCRDIKCRRVLRTTRRIKKQAWLDDCQRRQNVKGAFAMKRGYALTGFPRLANRHVLLVDDVLTTGATASEVSQVLLRAGAKRVTLAVLARAIRTN